MVYYIQLFIFNFIQIILAFELLEFQFVPNITNERIIRKYR